MKKSDQEKYIKVDYPEPHLGRTRKILAAHPEIKDLFGYRRITAVFIAAVVFFQIGMAIAVKDLPMWGIALLGFFVGAFANHALFAMIHECAHNLIFKKSWSNQVLGLFTNLPIVVPAAAGFRNFHLLHHRYQGEMDLDADLAGPKEAAWVGNSTWRKVLWYLFFPFIEGIVRPNRLKNTKVFSKWVTANLVVEVAFLAGLTYLFGWGAFAYLGFSTLFCIGLHPVGGRWIQEHYIVEPGQETYSYYGALNYTCFYVGYHNEHHDFMFVPWFNLPKVKAAAPEFYDTLVSHRSWTKLLFRFLTDKNLTLYSRVIRDSNAEARKAVRQKEKTFKGENVLEDFKKDMVFNDVELSPNQAPGPQATV